MRRRKRKENRLKFIREYSLMKVCEVRRVVMSVGKPGSGLGLSDCLTMLSDNSKSMYEKSNAEELEEVLNDPSKVTAFRLFMEKEFWYDESL